MRNFLFGVATVFLTQTLILLGQLLLSNRARRESSRAAVAERGRQSAERIMDLLNKGRKFLADDDHTDHLYDDDRVYDICHEIKAAGALIPDVDARDRVEVLANVLWYGDMISDRMRMLSPRSIGHLVYTAGVDLMGAFLRAEDVAAVETESTKRLGPLAGMAEMIEKELEARVGQVTRVG